MAADDARAADAAPMSDAEKQRELADRILGARIVAYGQSGDGTLHLDFEHRGTDDDSGVLILRTEDIHFNG